MKSQDILLLLKLISLSKQESRNQVSGINIDSPPLGGRDWNGGNGFDDSADLQLSLAPHRQIVEPQIDPYSVRSLSNFTGISKSEVSNALSRCYRCGLAKPLRGSTVPSVNTKGLQEFLIHGIRYVFPVKLQGLTRGIATGVTAPIFGGVLKSAGNQPPVWADPKGDTTGLAVEPLFKTVPMAARMDSDLYVLLALVDSIRLGLPREKTLAISILGDLLKEPPVYFVQGEIIKP